MNKNMLSLAILAATRMAPRFANEDGELMLDFLVGEFRAHCLDLLLLHKFLLVSRRLSGSSEHDE